MFQNVGAFVSFQGFLNNGHKLIEGQCSPGSADCQLKACVNQPNCSTHDSICLTTSKLGNVNKKKCNVASSGYRVVPTTGDQCIAKTSGNNAKNCNTTACGDTTNCLKLYKGEVLPDCGGNKRLNVTPATATTPPTLNCVPCTSNSFPVRDVKVTATIKDSEKRQAEGKGIELSKNSNLFAHVKTNNPIITDTNKSNLLLYKKGAEGYYVSYKNGTPLTGLYNRCFTCPTGYTKGSGNFCTEASCKVPVNSDFASNNLKNPTGNCAQNSKINHGFQCPNADLTCKGGYTMKSRPASNCDKGNFIFPTCEEKKCDFTNISLQNGTIPTLTACRKINNVPSGTLCSPLSCNQGYTLTPNTNSPHSQKNGIYCHRGTVYQATCEETKCDFRNISLQNGTIQTASQACRKINNVPSGTLCSSLSCNSGYTLTKDTKNFPMGTTNAQKSGIYCKKGTVYSPTCQGNSCTAPADTGNVIAPTSGNCNSGASVGHGIICNPQPTCKNTHTKSGTAKCSLGTFTNITCNPKTCKCDNGTKATDGNCINGPNTNTCTACISGYRLGPTPKTDKDARNCLQNTCKCSNGTPASGANQKYCTQHGEENCVACGNGYRLVDRDGPNDDSKPSKVFNNCKTNKCKCAPKICKCSNGQGYTGSTCPNHNTQKCKRCDSGYVLNGNSTNCDLTDKCQCTNGTPLSNVSGDNQCPFSTGTQACLSCNAGYYKRRGNLIELDTILVDTTTSKGGVELTFLNNVTIDTSPAGSYTASVNKNRLSIKINTPLTSTTTIKITCNGKSYIMNLPKTDETVMKQPLNDNKNKINNARVLRNFIEKQYPATCNSKACTGSDNGKWRDFDTGQCSRFCSLGSNFTEGSESGKKVYSNNKYKLITDNNGLTSSPKRYFPVTGTIKNPAMASGNVVTEGNLNQGNYEIETSQDFWISNPYDVNLKCTPDGIIDIMDSSGNSIINQCSDSNKCSKYVYRGGKKLCGRYVTLSSNTNNNQWKKAVQTYSNSHNIQNKSSNWANVINKLDKRLYQCKTPIPGYYLGGESKSNPFGTTDKYKYNSTNKKWEKQTSLQKFLDDSGQKCKSIHSGWCSHDTIQYKKDTSCFGNKMQAVCDDGKSFYMYGTDNNNQCKQTSAVTRADIQKLSAYEKTCATAFITPPQPPLQKYLSEQGQQCKNIHSDWCVHDTIQFKKDSRCFGGKTQAVCDDGKSFHMYGTNNKGQCIASGVAKRNQIQQLSNDAQACANAFITTQRTPLLNFLDESGQKCKFIPSGWCKGNTIQYKKDPRCFGGKTQAVCDYGSSFYMRGTDNNNQCKDISVPTRADIQKLSADEKACVTAFIPQR